MQAPDVIFPRTSPWVRLALLPACPKVSTKLPAVTVATDEFIQYRNDSGPERGTLRTERYGVNVYSKLDAQSLGLRAMACIKRAVDGKPVVAAVNASGPFEVVTTGDAYDAWQHVYFTVELTVRGTKF